MVSFLKTCLKGLLTIILSPLWITYFALSICWSIIVFFVTCFQNLIALIGKKSHGIYDTEYDKKAEQILRNPNFNPMTGNISVPPYQANYQIPPYNFVPPYYNGTPYVPPYIPPNNNDDGGNNR